MALCSFVHYEWNLWSAPVETALWTLWPAWSTAPLPLWCWGVIDPIAREIAVTCWILCVRQVLVHRNIKCILWLVWYCHLVCKVHHTTQWNRHPAEFKCCECNMVDIDVQSEGQYHTISSCMLWEHMPEIHCSDALMMLNIRMDANALT